MIVEIMNIIAGLVLAMGIPLGIPAIAKSLEKVAKWLGGFQTIIKIIAIIIGIWDSWHSTCQFFTANEFSSLKRSAF